MNYIFYILLQLYALSILAIPLVLILRTFFYLIRIFLVLILLLAFLFDLDIDFCLEDYRWLWTLLKWDYLPELIIPRT